MSEQLPQPQPPGCDHRVGEPVLQAGLLRSVPEDFQVVERLGFEPDGEGAHLLLRVRKVDCNTNWVASRLARMLEVSARDVGYSGLKDRHAVTEQWFSVPSHATGAIDADALAQDGLTVLEMTGHNRKLRRGTHRANEFRIVVREVAADPAALDERLSAISVGGVPNYFGLQRFGRGGNNLRLAQSLASGRRLRRRDRGFALSAARALIFNAILSHRVAEGSWNRLLPGDVAGLAGSRSHFQVEAVDAELEERLARQDVHPTGPLWGRGSPDTAAEIRVMEADIAAEHVALSGMLEVEGLEQARRPLRLSVEGLEWSLDGDALVLSFELEAGGFATSVLAAL
jgi:tRNA pseudouridine13 synthase